MKTVLAITVGAWFAAFSLGAAEPALSAPNLFQAIRSGDRAAVETLIKGGADVRGRDELGNTPLMAAALNGDVRALAWLLDAGAEVNAVNDAGATALMRAATFEEEVRLLVERGSDIQARSRLGNTALILAARKPGNSAAVKLLLDRGAAPNGANHFGATALMAAAAAEDIESARLLLDRGADANAKPKMDVNGFIWGGGRTPLMWAAFQGDEAMLRLLLERGAKVDEFTLVGGALAQAAWGGQVGAARLLLDAGAPVDQRDIIANYTPLHWAASSERSSPALAELLLARGADPNAEGGQPVDNFLGMTRTPLSLARKRGDTPIARALIEAGAKEAADVARDGYSGGEDSATGPAPTAAEAIQRALPLLIKTAEDSIPAFLRHASSQDCTSCHQQQLPIAAVSLAQSRHFEVDRAAVRHQIEALKRDIAIGGIVVDGERFTALEIALETTFHPEPFIMDGFVALALDFAGEPASAATDAMIHRIETIQHADGHWSWNLPRPPIQASDIAATASALRVIKAFDVPARKKELESRTERAREWLRKARVETNEERAHQLLGLAWAGEGSELLKKSSQELLKEQRSDGGWGQLAGLDSDAYATGQALYALMEGGEISSSDPAVRRGIGFLLQTQLADGSWRVHRRAHPFQPPMESGFPHGADSWISSAGTSWAVLALATSLDPDQTPPTPALTLTASALPLVAVVPAGGPAISVDFAREIQPLLERSCVPCHSGERPKGGFETTHRAALLRGGARGEPAVVPGNSAASRLIHVVEDRVPDLEMPPLGKREKFPALTKSETDRLRAWIDQGAEWPAGATIRASGN